MSYMRRGQQDYQELLLKVGGRETQRAEGARLAAHLSTPECKAFALHRSDAIHAERAHYTLHIRARTAPGRL